MKKLLPIIAVLMVSCGMFDSEDPVPMFLSIDEVELQTGPQEGSDSEKIEDVWVYVDGSSVGVFELPALVPVLSNDDKVKVDIRAGIRNNGQRLRPKEYPFYKLVSMEMDFKELETVPVDLTYQYLDNIAFSILEDFEAGNVFGLDLDDDPSSNVGRSADTPYGEFCGKINVLNDTLFLQTTFDILNISDFGNSQVYLELDFKCDVKFSIGFQGYDSNGTETTEFFYIFREQEDWDKIYLDLSSALNGGEYESYRIIIAGVPDQLVGSIWLDNIKLAYLD